MMLKKAPTCRKGDGRTMVASHAVNSDGDHERPVVEVKARSFKTKARGYGSG